MDKAPVISPDPLQGDVERRREPRFCVEMGAEVRISHCGRALEVSVVDLSLGGMRIRLREEAPKIDWNFTVTNGAAGSLRVRQIWARGRTMGLRFDMPWDSRLARELRCVRLLLGEESTPEGGAYA